MMSQRCRGIDSNKLTDFFSKLGDDARARLFKPIPYTPERVPKFGNEEDTGTAVTKTGAPKPNKRYIYSRGIVDIIRSDGQSRFTVAL